jgi:predicted component of type VI protein secretion system
MYVLRLFDESDLTHPLDARLLREGILRIGRDPGADWTIPDPDREISRAHCELEAGPAGLMLRSVGANGVFDNVTGLRLPDHSLVSISMPGSLRFGRYQLVVDHAPQNDTPAGAEARTLLMTPPLGASTSVPSEWSDAPAPIRSFAEGSLLEAFCEGAGMDASLLLREDPAEIMRRAGAVYRQMVLGIGDLMSERERARAHYHLTRTTISGADNNPFKWAPTQRLAIDLLLGGAQGFLSGPAALRASFEDIKRHLVATFAGLQASLRAAVGSFDPSSIDEAVAERASLLKSRAALQQQEIEARYNGLRRQLDEVEVGSLDHAFVAAYDEAENRAKQVQS